MNFHEGGSRINIGRGRIACASARCNMQRALFAALKKRGKDGERGGRRGGGTADVAHICARRLSAAEWLINREQLFRRRGLPSRADVTGLSPARVSSAMTYPRRSLINRKHRARTIDQGALSRAERR